MEQTIALFNKLDAGVITSLTALFAVVLSPLVTLAVARRQLRGSVVSANRQGWINELHKTVSEYGGVMNRANQMRAEGNATVERMFELMHRSLELESHVMLMLNPGEAPHKKIAEVTTKARIAVFRTQADFDPKVWND